MKNTMIDYTKEPTRKGLGLHPIEKCPGCDRNGLNLEGALVHTMQDGRVTDGCGIAVGTRLS